MSEEQAIAEIRQLGGWGDATNLSFPPHATDADLVHLKSLPRLQELYLNNTQITDAGLVHLTGLTNLETLGLGFTQITDVGLAHLTRLTNLQWLDLWNTQITDAGLVHLKGLTRLDTLFLRGKVTNAGVKDLKEALPNLKRLLVAPLGPHGGRQGLGPPPA